MNNKIYTPLQIREIFHMEFLRWFSRKIKADYYCLKGGVNLRLFFKSVRYSEEIDLDISKVSVDKAKDVVMEILVARGFLDSLKSFGIEQVPQVITLASTSHTTMIRTQAGVFSVHQISPVLFGGFDWYKGDGSFLIAEPEKALIDSLYLSSRKKNQFGYFPELHFPDEFSLKKAARWIERVPEQKIRAHIRKKLESLMDQSKP